MSDASNLTTAIPTVSEPALERMIFLSDQSVLIGALITILLTGIGLSQAYYYFNEYSEDAWWSKALVVVVTSLGLLESICVCKVTYRTLITVAHDTDVTNIIKIDWSTPTVIAVHVILGGIVLLYFVYSCFRLLENRKFQKSIISVLLAIIVVHIGFGIASVVHTSTIQTVLQMNVDRKQEQIPWLTTQVAADVLVSATLCLSLPTPSYKQTRSVVHRIVVYAISRGILTSAAALVQLAQDFIDPQNMRTVAAEWIIPWVYTNSLLAALNSRKRLRRRLRADVNMTSDMPTQQPISVMDFYRPNMTNEDGSATAHQITPVPVEAKREALEMEVYTPAKTV